MKRAQTAGQANVRWFGVSSDLRQPTNIRELSISLNGRFAATVDEQNVIRVFDLDSGACRGQVKVPAKALKKFEHVHSVSVADDGEHVVAAIEVGFVSGDLQAVKQTLFGYSGAARMLPDGSGYVHLQGTLSYVDGDRRDSDARVEHGTFGGEALDIAPDGRVACALWDGDRARGLLRVLSKTRQPLASIEVDEQTYMAMIGFVNDESDTVTCVTQDGRVLWWSFASAAPKLVSHAMTRTPAYPRRLLAPLRAAVVMRESGTGCDIVDLESGAVRVAGTTSQWAVSADGKRLICAHGATIARCDPATFAVRDAVPALRTPVRGVAFTPSGDELWSVDDEGAHRWNVADGGLVSALPIDTAKIGARPFDFRGSGERAAIALATTSRENESTGTGIDALLTMTKKLRCVSRDGATRIDVDDTRVRALSSSDGAVKAQWPRTAKVGVAALSPDASHLVWSDREGGLHVVNVDTGEQLARLPAPLSRVVFSLTVSPDGTRVATCTDSSTIHHIDVATGGVVHALKMKRRTADPITYSPDGRWIAASDQVVTTVWDARSGAKHVSLPVGAHALAFSPSSELLALGGDGVLGLVRIDAR